MDEADALLGRRDSGVNSGINATGVVPQFLAEMDGLEDSAAMFVLATNRPEALDPVTIVLDQDVIDRVNGLAVGIMLRYSEARKG